MAAIDDVTEMKVIVAPAAKIRPLETAVIHIQFFGKKKQGFFGTLFGGDKEDKRVQSSDWKIDLTSPDGGWLSKMFLFQQAGERTGSGLENIIRQGLGAVSAKDSVLYTAPAKPGKYTLKVTNKNLSELITIDVSEAAASTENTRRVSFPDPAESTDPYFDLAEHYAPFIAQETWFTPDADLLARFDYDGNWRGEDNWENLNIGSRQAFVYYAVMETRSHWFLLYNFFHARDYSDSCIAGTCHENDNEGLIITIRKDGSEFGRLEVMETLAHNNIYSFTNDPEIGNGLHDIDGRIDLFETTHPIIFIEAGGHGVYGSSARASLFDVEKMEFKSATGITYIYKGSAETPAYANDRRIGYALLPIYSEWWSRGNKDSPESNETFEDFYSYAPYGNRPKTASRFIAGAFRGRTAGDNMAKPFWAWHDRRTRDKKVVNTGQWALDPAYSVSVNLRFPANKPMSTDYVFNQFLDLNEYRR